MYAYAEYTVPIQSLNVYLMHDKIFIIWGGGWGYIGLFLIELVVHLELVA